MQYEPKTGNYLPKSAKCSSVPGSSRHRFSVKNVSVNTQQTGLNDSFSFLVQTTSVNTTFLSSVGHNSFENLRESFKFVQYIKKNKKKPNDASYSEVAEQSVTLESHSASLKYNEFEKTNVHNAVLTFRRSSVVTQSLGRL